MDAGTPLLEVQDLHVVVGRGADTTELVRGVGFAVRSGEMVGIVGESGCGKTMTAMSLVQLLPTGIRVSSGHVRFQGEELLGAAPSRLRLSRRKWRSAP